jgi:hypothetical protein
VRHTGQIGALKTPHERQQQQLFSTPSAVPMNAAHDYCSKTIVAFLPWAIAATAGEECLDQLLIQAAGHRCQSCITHG